MTICDLKIKPISSKQIEGKATTTNAVNECPGSGPPVQGSFIQWIAGVDITTADTVGGLGTDILGFTDALGRSIGPSGSQDVIYQANKVGNKPGIKPNTDSAGIQTTVPSFIDVVGSGQHQMTVLQVFRSEGTNILGRAQMDIQSSNLVDHFNTGAGTPFHSATFFGGTTGNLTASEFNIFDGNPHLHIYRTRLGNASTYWIDGNVRWSGTAGSTTYTSNGVYQMCESNVLWTGAFMHWNRELTNAEVDALTLYFKKYYGIS